MANICVTGIWHQGTVVSACLADLGNKVVGVCDPKTTSLLNKATPPVHEPVLPEIIQRNLVAGRLRYTTNYGEALHEAEFVFICTDTPVDGNDDSDLSSIYAVAESVGDHVRSDIILCVTAQVPVGASEELASIVRKHAATNQCVVAYVPEFLRLGTAVQTFLQADRFVIGCNDQAVAHRVAALYEPLGRLIVFTDIRSAEMAKHASNAFLATSISFINEIARLCETLGVDAVEVSSILKLDKRIGKHAFLSPGLGFAGGTLGREIRALQKLAHARRVQTPLLDAVWSVNSERARLVGRRLQDTLGALEGKQVGILGLTYKAGTSTLRRAISLDIVRDLIQQGARVKAFDPLANWSEVSGLPPMEVCASAYAAARGSGALILVTEWDGLANLDLVQLRGEMRGDVFLDTRNLLDPKQMAGAGFRYFGIGR